MKRGKNMGEYTHFLSARGYEISPEDENYTQELLEVAQSFRTFDAALDEFIIHKGYQGDIGDTEAKVRYIKGKFEEAGIPMETRILRSWFQKHIQADKRDIAVRFCFAFGLTIEETEDFFRRVYLQRSLDCHTIREAIYYYCLSHGMSYAKAQELLAQAPNQDGKGQMDDEGEALFTGTIIKELERFQSPEELLAFLTDNRDQFGYNNATAKKYIKELWRRIAGENGLADRELFRRYPGQAAAGRQRSVWDIYQQIFGLLDYDRIGGDKLFLVKGDRTLQPLLKANDLIHPLVRRSFPDRQGLEAIISGNWQSDEVVRKTLILLAFYRFWTDLFLKGKEAEYMAGPHDAQRCLASINRLLLDARYPDLYEGNPYDWIFLYASQDTYPLDAFRFFMREVYLNKLDPEEGAGAL
jgi:hypothetical protein